MVMVEWKSALPYHQEVMGSFPAAPHFSLSDVGGKKV